MDENGWIWYNFCMEKQPTITIPKAEYDALKADVADLNQQLQWLMEQVRLGKHHRFGASSEKSEYDQPNLFNEAEVYPLMKYIVNHRGLPS